MSLCWLKFMLVVCLKLKYLCAEAAWTRSSVIDILSHCSPQVSLKCRAPEVSQCVFQSYEAMLKNWMKSTLSLTQPLPSETDLLWPEQQPLQPVSVSQRRSDVLQLQPRLRSHVSISFFKILVPCFLTQDFQTWCHVFSKCGPSQELL